MERKYQYVVVRYVPDLVREEGVNVGIIARDLDSSDFAFKFLPRSSTVRRLVPSADQRLVSNFEHQLSASQRWQPSLFQDAEPPLGRVGHPASADFFTRARAEFNGNLQMSGVRGQLGSAMSAVVQKLYNTYVAEPSAGPRPINYQAIAPHQMRQRLWSAFERRNLIAPGRVQRQLVLEGKHAPWTFDLGYKNGQLNLISSLALNAPAIEMNLGRALVMKGMIEEVGAKQDVHAIAVIELPRKPEATAGVGDARGILKDAHIDTYEISNVAQLVASVEKDLRTHG